MQNKSILIKLSHFLATGFYSGLSPIMPGTCGTLASALVLYAINCISPNFFTSEFSYILALGVTILAVMTSNICLKSQVFGNDLKDPQKIVIDEFAGYYVTLIGLSELDIWVLSWGFIFFRLFDMTKPSLVRKAESLPGAWGIVADDVVAGFFAAVCLRFVLFFF